MELSKSDWKLFRERLPLWQEAYMDRLNHEYIELLQNEAPASDKFWALDERLKRDKQNPGVVLQVSKSSAIFDIAEMVQRGVISENDLTGFSDGVFEAVKLLNNRRNSDL